MKSQSSITRVLKLELTEEETAWLHAVMQNPLHGQEPGQESREDEVMRSKFFNATMPLPR